MVGSLDLFRAHCQQRVDGSILVAVVSLQDRLDHFIIHVGEHVFNLLEYTRNEMSGYTRNKMSGYMRNEMSDYTRNKKSDYTRNEK